jgi:hypothetical protein
MALEGAHLDVASDWIMDSGTKMHMSPNRANFHTFETIVPRMVLVVFWIRILLVLLEARGDDHKV